MPAQVKEGSLLPSSCGFGSHFSFSVGIDTVHVNLWQRRLSPVHGQLPSVISGCQLELQRLCSSPNAALNLLMVASKTPELTAPLLGMEGDRHLSRNQPYCLIVSGGSLVALHSFFSFSTRLQSSRGSTHFSMPVLHQAWQATGLTQGLLAAGATQINQGCSLTSCNGIFCYACMGPTAFYGT